MLAYKTPGYGSRLVMAPRFYPSTKACSACGHVKGEMPLGERLVPCAVCGRDRPGLERGADLASLVAGRSPETPNACGADGAGQENGLVKLAAPKPDPWSPKPGAAASGNKRR